MRRWRCSKWCLLLSALAIAAGLTVVLGAPAGAQSSQTITQGQGTECSIFVDFGPSGFAVEVRPDPAINFVAPPGFSFEIRDPDGEEIASGRRPDNDPGVIFVDTQRWFGGTYLISGQSAGGAGGQCQTTVDVDGPEPVEPLQPPEVAVDCGPRDRFFLAESIQLQAAADDPDGEIVDFGWVLPDNTVVVATALNFTLRDTGEQRFEFFAVDNDGQQQSSACTVQVFPIVPQTATPVPEPTSTPGPGITVIPGPAGTPTPVPEPTSTPVPAPTSTPVPAPTSTPVPAPTSTPGADTSPTPVPGPTTTALPDVTATAVPEPAPSPDPNTDTAEINPGASDPDSGVIPGVLEANWEEPLIVGESTKFVVVLEGTDWTPRAAEIRADAVIQDTDADGTRVYRLAIYGAVGDIDLRIDVDKDLLRLVNPFGDEAPPQVQTVRLTPFLRDEAVWHLEPIDVGTANVRILVDGVEKATPPNPPRSAEDLTLIKVEDMQLDLSLEIDTERRKKWLGFTWWHGLGPLFLFGLPIAGFGWPLRRHPSGQLPASSRPIFDVDQVDGGGDLGLIFSGGGLRACAFSLGAAMYLADVGAWDRVRQIASVSGGSLTNAFVAQRADELGHSPDHASDFAPLVRRIANHGLALERAATLLAIAVGLGSSWIGVLLWNLAPTPWAALPWIVLGILAYALVCWLAFVWLGLRPSLARWIPEFTGVDPELNLNSLGAGADRERTHVFTSTTTRSNHAHFAQSNMFITTPRGAKDVSEDERPSAQVEYEGSPKELTTVEVVRASAAFPGLPRVLVDPREVGFASYDGKRLALRDGGTLDNLGHIHQTLLAHQSRDLQNFLTSYGAVHQWLVVDSSKYARRPPAVRAGLMRLVEALNIGVAFDLGEMAGTEAERNTRESSSEVRHHFESHPGLGIMLDLHQSPVEICRSILDEAGSTAAFNALFRHGDLPPDYEAGAERERAAASVLVALVESQGRSGLESFWRQRAEANTNVRTTLSSLKPTQAAGLVHHGYVLAATLAHVDLGWELPAVEQLSEERFRSMAEAGSPRTPSGVSLQSARDGVVGSASGSIER